MQGHFPRQRMLMDNIIENNERPTKKSVWIKVNSFKFLFLPMTIIHGNDNSEEEPEDVFEVGIDKQ